MKKLRWAVTALIALLVVAQFIRPARTNPPVDERRTMQGSTQVPADVAAMLDRSCKDCHSSKTEWPWYSNIAPASWYMVHDVNEGRKELNFSEWGTFTTRRVARKLLEICEQLEKTKMPPAGYVLFHPTAKLSEAERRSVCDWAKQERARVLAAQGTPSR